MTAPTAWAALPNARHIDRVLADLQARPDARDAAWDAARGAAWDAARAAAWDAARDAARALIAWDDVAYILALPSGAVRMLIETCTDHHKHAAVLLLPACVAFNGEGETA